MPTRGELKSAALMAMARAEGKLRASSGGSRFSRGGSPEAARRPPPERSASQARLESLSRPRREVEYDKLRGRPGEPPGKGTEGVEGDKRLCSSSKSRLSSAYAPQQESRKSAARLDRRRSAHDKLGEGAKAAKGPVAEKKEDEQKMLTALAKSNRLLAKQEFLASRAQAHIA